MNLPILDDPYLGLPLDGVRLIEASAGTGKTFTLATLFTRLVVERGLRIGQILAVTFTEAATQELRRRIRERLTLALRLVPGDVAGAAPADAAPDAHLTEALLKAHLAASGELPARLKQRLQQAVEEIDLAAIFTIHGFCARVLREHAVESGQTLAAPDLLPNDRELLAEVAADLWRLRAADAATAEDIIGLWPGGPSMLASDLREMVRHPELLPPAPAPGPADDGAALLQVLQDAGTALAEAFGTHGTGFFEAVFAAIEAGVLSKVSYKPEWLASLWHWLEGFAVAPGTGQPPHPKLAKLTSGELTDGTNKKFAGLTPISPMSHEIDGYLAALARVEEWRGRRRLRLLHSLHRDAVARLALVKRQRRVQTYDDLVDGVANALQSPQAEVLARQLRTQYAIALVDEFQDTDDRQWSIFSNVFGEGPVAREVGLAPALLLIGDPKQAIYGFRGGDVRTYLAAARTAEAAPPLAYNFRSRPALLASIDAMYAQAGSQAFQTDGIAFHPVQPGTQRLDTDLQRDGTAAPALTLWQAPEPPVAKGKQKPWNVGPSLEQCTSACVAAIHGWLSDGRARTATINGRAVQAGDIAVLVRDHKQAARIQQALGEVGIPAVAAGKRSLFATEEAQDLLALLQALLDPGDDARLRAALATVLIGQDAAAIAALETEGERHRQWQQQALDWRERWRRGGPLALIGDLGAAQAQRLLTLADGERRLTNYLQLAELLQEADARALGPHGLVDWLGRRIANADDNDEAQQLRLESDARRVQIVTLHKSKGLEYPLVFLPYAGIGRRGRGAGRHCVVHLQDIGRRLHWNTGKDDPAWMAAEAAWKQEQRAEEARLLYVGLTRAEHALWVATGPLYQHDGAALHPMVSRLLALQAAAGDGAVAIDSTSPLINLPRLALADDSHVPPARVAGRHIAPEWWVYSFTQLANADAGIANDPMASATVESGGGADEPSSDHSVAPVQSEPFDPRFAGNRFGVVLHDVFETCDFAAWRDWQPGHPAPEGQGAAMASALQRGGYAQDELADGVAVLTRLTGHTLTVQLPEGSCLAGVPETARRNEMEFHFAMRPTRIDVLLSLLHRHGVLNERQAFGARQRLEGLMTGLIDLTYQHDGRWYVLDYKSNRLPGYDAADLSRAMAHSEYELQALIYTVALHRWLRFRLGADYDYARDFGGVRYLFCRGLDAARDPSPGVFAWRFEPALVDGVDALFAGKAPPGGTA
ncbi:MAG TPA: exodeoxyribonuclease V subunit beta [Stenotrophomonas sp.]|jgi:exodeoxyribonuclease V beta subunit